MAGHSASSAASQRLLRLLKKQLARSRHELVRASVQATALSELRLSAASPAEPCDERLENDRGIDTGSYAPAFWICIGCSGLSAVTIGHAAPRQIRAVAGRVPRRATGSA